jgi:hypothetical protein
MMGWRFLLRVVIKTAVLFVLANLVFALLNPIDALGSVSLYNVVVPGRERLPYGENSAQSYNLTMNSLSAMFSSQVVARPKAADEYRVLLMGDSSVWGWLLENADTYAANVNVLGLTVPDGRRIVAYNVGYPEISATKDLVLLDYALQHYDPDAVVWLVTLMSIQPSQQLRPAVVLNNAPQARDLIARYDLTLDPNDPGFVDPDLLGRTIVGQRRALADWLRLQTYGFSWAATGIDQYIPAEYDLRTSDFEDDDLTWDDRDPFTITRADLAFDVLDAGAKRAGEAGVPLLFVNEPIYISSGRNSDLRYNVFYPRWAYDQFRPLAQDWMDERGYLYRDWWDRIAPDEFTDSPIHLTPAGSRQLSVWLGDEILALSSSEAS